MLAFTLPAFALDLNVTVTMSRPRTIDIDASFADLTPGEVRSVDLPCGPRAMCRLAVVVTPAPDPDRWLVKVDVAEVRHRLFGGEVLRPLSNPTFMVPVGQTANLRVGRNVHIEADRATATAFQGIRIVAKLSEPEGR